MCRQLLVVGDAAAVGVLVGGLLIKGGEGGGGDIDAVRWASSFASTSSPQRTTGLTSCWGVWRSWRCSWGEILVEGGEGDGSNNNFVTTVLPVGCWPGGSSSKVGSDGGGNNFDAVVLLGLQLCFDLVASGD